MSGVLGQEMAASVFERLERENRDLTPTEWIAFLEELIGQCRTGIAAAREDLRRG